MTGVQTCALPIYSLLRREGEPIVAHNDDAEAIGKFSSAYPGADYARAFAAIERAVSLLYKNVYIPLILVTLAAELRRAVLPAGERSGARP